MATWVGVLKARSSPFFLAYQCGFLAYLLVMSLTFGTLIIFNPSFHIDNLYVPALNNSTAGGGDNVIFFNLMIHNKMVNVGFRYHAVNLTFSYSANTSTSTVLGTYTVAGFYQGMKKKAHRRDVVIVTSSLPWKEAALLAHSVGSTAEFRVDVAADVKLKNLIWYFKEKRITAGGTVLVDDSGKKVGRKSIKLQSGESPPSKAKVIFWVFGFIILIFVGVMMIILGLAWFFLH